jgi:low temperature requirement protein LtrA
VALDAHHFAERFGLFIIILLGEVVVQAGEAAADGRHLSAARWSGLVAAMVLAATFWWSYFDAAAGIDLDRLKLSGGSPAVARTIFAAGHMLPAFALLIAAAGVGLLLGDDPARIGYWLTCIGTALYLAGTSNYIRSRSRHGRVLRTAALVVTYAFGVLHPLLSPAAYLWLMAAWVAGNVALAALTSAAAGSAAERRR